MTMDGARSSRNLVRCSKLVMRIVEFMYRLVMAIGEDSWSRFMGVHVQVVRLGRVLWLKHVLDVLWYRFEVVLLQGASAFASMLATACMGVCANQCRSMKTCSPGLTLLAIALVRWAVLFRVSFLSALAMNMLRSSFSQAPAMLALGYWPALLVHMNEWTICSLVSACDFEQGLVRRGSTYRNDGKSSHDGRGYTPRRRTSLRLRA